MAPAAIIASKPSVSPQEKTPAVTSKIPEKSAFKRGEESHEKIPPPKAISITPQEITINAHIRKQLSAAEIIASTAQAELLFLGMFREKAVSSFLFEKTEIKRAIIAEDKNCAAKSKKPIFKSEER